MDQDHDSAASAQGGRAIAAIVDESTADNIFRASMRGLGDRSVARMFQLPVSSVREILRQERAKEEDPLKADTAEAVRSEVFQLDAIIEDLAGIASREKGYLRLRATELRFRVMRERAQLQRALVGLPHGVRPLRTEAEIDQLVDALLDVLDEREMLTEEIVEAVGKAIEPPSQLEPDDFLLTEEDQP
jgi:hypothetical protein